MHKQRMAHAAHFMLDGEQRRARFRIDKILESILMLVALLRDEALVEQFPVRSGEVCDVNLDVMAVVGRGCAVGLAKHEMLSDADLDPCESSAVELARVGLGAYDLAVKPRDTVSGSHRHVEFDIRDAKRDPTEPLIWHKASDAISPRTPGLDESFLLDEIEARAFQPFANSSQPPHQRLAIRHHDASMTAQNLRLIGRQMELAASDIDPHVGGAGHQVRIARQAESGEVKDGRLLLIGNCHVDVFQRDDITEVFNSSIESTLHKNLRSSLKPAHQMKRNDGDSRN